MIEEEKWIPIPNYEGYYEISNKGKVRSLDRTIMDRRGQKRNMRGRILVPFTDHEETYVNLMRDGLSEFVTIKNLAAQAVSKYGDYSDDETQTVVVESS